MLAVVYFINCIRRGDLSKKHIIRQTVITTEDVFHKILFLYILRYKLK